VPDVNNLSISELWEHATYYVGAVRTDDPSNLTHNAQMLANLVERLGEEVSHFRPATSAISAEPPLGHRLATADEEADYLAGHELVHGAVETEHGLFVPEPDHPNLYDADTNERIGPASPEQVAASEAAAYNGGIIRVDRTTGELSETGRRVYTDGWET
jgi:hypothetical protein